MTNFLEISPDETLKRTFECPSCLGYMKRKIYVCLTGHSLCDECWNQLQECPVCREALSHTRNYTLETVVTQMKFPCENSNHGCKETCYMSGMAEHLDICGFRIYSCKLGRGCKWKGRRTALERHALDVHRRSVLMGVENIFYWKNILPKNEMTMIIAHREIFYFHRKTQDDTVYFVVQYVGKSEDSIQYYYEVTITSDQYQHREVCIKENCCDDLTDNISEIIEEGEAIQVSSTKLETLSSSNGYTLIKLSILKA